MRRERRVAWRRALRRATDVLLLGVFLACFWTTAEASAGPLFSKLPSELSEGLYAPSAALLPNGDVLVAGGWKPPNSPVKMAELFDPATGVFAKLTEEMAIARGEASAVSLPSGKVLIVGGYNEAEEELAKAELFNPTTGKFEAPAGEMTAERAGAAAALLPGGKVLIAGGQKKAGNDQKTAELYNPATAKFEAIAAEMHVARYQPGTVALPNGKVLIAGGTIEPSPGKHEDANSAELYNPTAGTFELLGPGHELTDPRSEMGVVLLQDGFALIAGGFNESEGNLQSEEIFNYLTDTFEKVGHTLIEARDAPASVTLSDGRVLILAGATGSGYSRTAEIAAVSSPAVQTGFSTVSSSAATLHGGEESEAVAGVYFQYGATTAYGGTTSRQPVPASLAGPLIPQPSPRVPGIPTYFSATVSGLAPATTYHFRAVTENAGGISYGSDQTFTTQAVAATVSSPVSPQITGLSESHHVWREGSKLAQISNLHGAPVGTTFKLALNESAKLKLVFSELLSGRRVGGMCVAQNRASRHHHACRRSLTRGTITLSGRAGANELSFQGRLSRTRKLPLGSYSVAVAAISAAGSSKPQKLTFTVVR